MRACMRNQRKRPCEPGAHAQHGKRDGIQLYKIGSYMYGDKSILCLAIDIIDRIGIITIMK